QKNSFALWQVDIAPIASQYPCFMDASKSLNAELTAEYLGMAALRADLKSRLLLPTAKSAAAVEQDPKQDLIERLENYLRIKQAAERLGQMTILERDTFQTNVHLGEFIQPNEGHSADLLRDALLCVFNRPEPVIHQVQQEPVLLEERIAYIESCLESGEVLSFADLLKPSQGRMGMVVTFMAVLELTRQQRIQIIATGI